MENRFLQQPKVRSDKTMQHDDEMRVSVSAEVAEYNKEEKKIEM